MNKFGMIGFAAVIGISVASLIRLQVDLLGLTPLLFLSLAFIFIWLVGHHLEKALEKRSYSDAIQICLETGILDYNSIPDTQLVIMDDTSGGPEKCEKHISASFEMGASF